MLITKLKQNSKRALSRSHAILGTFIPNKYVAYRFAGGRIYLNIKESPMMLARALGLYELRKQKVLSSLLRPGGTFIDVGANKGDFSLLAAKLVGRNGRVLSFEPEPTNCQWIAKSVKLNGYDNITLYELALSDTNGRAQLYLGKKSGWHTLVKGQPYRSEGVLKVATRTLDRVLGERTGNSRVDMMKIDVEGAELEVLKGACEMLSKNKDIILLIDVHPQLGVNPKEVCDLLCELDFRICEMRLPFVARAQDDTGLREILACR